jgi:hypothetical protein
MLTEQEKAEAKKGCVGPPLMDIDKCLWGAVVDGQEVL